MAISARPPDTHAFKRLTADEALRALYIDFEGRKDELPVLLGVLRHPGRDRKPFVYQQVVDETFADLGCRVTTFKASVENVVRRAEHKDRRIVSWSQHDLDVVRRLADEEPELVERFERRYANARSVAERWRNKCHGGDRPAIGSLAEYLTLIGYSVPPEAAPGFVGETIRILRHTLGSGRSLTARQQKRWEELLEHNRHDCAGMRRVCLQATREVDAADN